jgi:putative DNA primase/helicase
MLDPSPPKTFCGDLADPPAALAPLCHKPHWVVWKWQRNGNDKWTQPPFYAPEPVHRAANNRPTTWSTHRAAVAAVLRGRANGVGFVLTSTKVAAVDLDKCRDPESGVIAQWAQQILDAAPNAYREITVSGTGLRVIGIASGPETHRRFNIAGREGAGVEVYRRATRYITVSGLEQGHCTKLVNIDALIDKIVAQYDNATSHERHGGNSFDDIDELIKNGAPETQRSEAFARVVWSLAGQGLSQNEIEDLLKQYPNGIAFKYNKRLRKEIDRCYTKWQRQNKSQTKAQTTATRAVLLTRADKVEPESINWAWKNRFAFGKLALIAGDPGLGKSTILIDIVATHSTGAAFPCGEGRAQQCESIFLTAEDGLCDTLVPRLIAAEADLSKIHFLTGTKTEGAGDDDVAMFDLTKDIAVLRKAFEANPKIRIFVIDPITAYLGATEAKSNAEVRKALTPLISLIEDTGVLVLANNHLNKGAGKALYRVLDSIAFVAVGRTVHLVVKDTDNPDNRKFLCDKTNIGSKPLGLTYIIQKCWIPGKHGEEIETSRISWGTQHIDETADEAMAEKPDPTMTSEAVEFLQIVLANGPMAVTDIEREARSARLLGEDQELRKSKPFQSAKKILGVTTNKSDFVGGWVWTLTPKAAKAP